MKVYLAARYGRRLELCAYRNELEAQGIRVTSRWLNGSHQLDKDGSPIGEHGEHLVETGDGEEAARLRQRFVQEDVADVLASDCVVSFTEEPRTPTCNRGGRHVEFGVAVATGKRLMVVGYRENLFHWLPEVEFFEGWADAMASVLIHAREYDRQAALVDAVSCDHDYEPGSYGVCRRCGGHRHGPAGSGSTPRRPPFDRAADPLLGLGGGDTVAPSDAEFTTEHSEE